MAAEQRKLLAALMGDQYATSSSDPQVEITSEKVCRSYLAGFCPNEMFTNTKSDLSECDRIHSDKLKEQYEAASDEQKRKWGFEIDFMRHMGELISACDREIHRAEVRLEKTPAEIKLTTELLNDIADLDANIEIGLQEVEALALQRAVAIAYSELWKVEQFQAAKADKERELKAINDNQGSSGHQKLQVCDKCGAFLSRLDNDRRLADHFYGKMHLGYRKMREVYAELKKKYEDQQLPKREAGDYDIHLNSKAPGDTNGSNGYVGGSDGYGDRRGGGGPRGGGRGRGGRGRGRGGFDRF